LTVNARSDPPSALDGDASTPGVIDAIGSVTSVPIDATTAAVAALVREASFTLSEQRIVAPAGAEVRTLDVYDIAVDFDQIPEARSDLRDRLKRIATTWTLSGKELDDIDDGGRLMLQQHPCFQRLLSDLGIRADFIDAKRTPYCITRP